jgi:N-methylhydantoinase B/oxoprolinase/acetone carboxylase alpha subunit
VIAERRRHGPRGLEGGEDGAPGATLLNGSPLPAKWRGRLAAGDVMAIQTPGGGGHGPPP